MATKADLAEMATKADLAEMATKADLAEMATQADLAEMATKADLGDLATHAELDTLNANLQALRLDLLARIDRLQEALTQQQQESVVNHAIASRARDAMRGIEEEVSALTRMVMRLSRRLDDIEGREAGH
jgi:hypothetical protein